MKKLCSISLFVFISFSIDQSADIIHETAFSACLEYLIYGGAEVRPSNKYPWMVTISQEENSTICGGSLISNRYVLTAGHCLTNIGIFRVPNEEEELDYDMAKKLVSDIVLGIGVHDKRFPVVTVSAENVTFPPDFNVLKKDIVLIKLNRTIEFQDNIKPICIPEDERFDHPSSHSTIAGWGMTTDGPTNVLMEAQLRVMPESECLDSLMKEMNLNVTWPLLCAEVKGKSSCPGDSGGPLFVSDAGKYYIIGVSSVGPKVCEKNATSGYTRVSSFSEWIKENSDYSGEKCENSYKT